MSEFVERENEHTCKRNHIHTYTYFGWPVRVWVLLNVECLLNEIGLNELIWCIVHCSHIHTEIYTCIKTVCNDWKWNKNQKFTWNYVILLIERPLTQSSERAIVADPFFFLLRQIFLLQFQVLFTTVTHVVAVINAVATINLSCVLHLFFFFCLHVYVCLSWNNISSTCEQKKNGNSKSQNNKHPNNRYRANITQTSKSTKTKVQSAAAAEVKKTTNKFTGETNWC